MLSTVSLARSADQFKQLLNALYSLYSLYALSHTPQARANTLARTHRHTAYPESLTPSHWPQLTEHIRQWRTHMAETDAQ